jgi:hypothetical protein
MRVFAHIKRNPGWRAGAEDLGIWIGKHDLQQLGGGNQVG